MFGALLIALLLHGDTAWEPSPALANDITSLIDNTHKVTQGHFKNLW